MKTFLSVAACASPLLVLGFVAPPAQAAPGQTSADKLRWATPKPPYPAEAHDKHLQGVGTLRFRTDAAGRVAEARMDPSTGSKVLDEASLQFVRTYWHGPPNQRHSTVLDYGFLLERPEVAAYGARIKGLIGKRWYDYVSAHTNDLPPGKTDIDFLVTPNGAVKDVRVTAGREYHRLAALSTAAILDTKIPPMSPGLRKLLPEQWGGNFRVHFDFAAYTLGAPVPAGSSPARAKPERR